MNHICLRQNLAPYLWFPKMKNWYCYTHSCNINQILGGISLSRGFFRWRFRGFHQKCFHTRWDTLMCTVCSHQLLQAITPHNFKVRQFQQLKGKTWSVLTRSKFIEGLLFGRSRHSLGKGFDSSVQWTITCSHQLLQATNPLNFKVRRLAAG